jgi:hypothetical protein
MAIVASRKRRHRRKKHRPRRHSAPHTTSKATPKPAATKPAAPKAPVSKPVTTSTGSAGAWVSPLPVATSRERLFLNRFGTGFTQNALARLRALGSPDAWLAAQLAPSGVPESGTVSQVDAWFAPLFASASQKYGADQTGTKPAWTYGRDLGNWTMLRRIYSERSVLETMTDFWSNHLHVSTGHDRAWTYRFDYDATIRSHALGTFEDLLRECSLHPAMRLFLDNWLSVKGAPNENQGRELLELHTVGHDAGYTEAMVKDSAKILSGYTLDWGSAMTARYDPTKHTTGAVNVLGFSAANTSSDGQAVTVAYLKYLAHHPATARRIATKLATYFVSDSPSDGLIDTLAAVYTSSGTDISAVLSALSQQPEFLTSEGRKVRTPYADVVAAARILDIQAHSPTSSSSWANALNYMHGAAQLFSWPRPDGAPITNAPWSAASRLFASYVMHQNFSGGWWPTEAVTYRAYGSWLPAPQVRFDRYVDHLCRLWFGKAADARLLLAANQAVTRPEAWAVITPSTVVDKNHQLAGWGFPRLVMALLDTPDHMTT